MSIDQSGFSIISPSMLLVGTVNPASSYTVEISDAIGNNYGNIVSCDLIDEVVVASVINGCNGNSCWSELIVEDKQGPVFSCPTANIEVECDTDISTLGSPLVTDNCGSINDLAIIDETIDDSQICAGGAIIVRTWMATDDYGK